MELVCRGTAHLGKALGAKGFNIGANIGRCAGAGEEHLHFHVLPRWNGDTNFMPIFTDTKVISEFVEQTYDKLLPYFSSPPKG
jgi:ATP adenylyltransferase